MKTHTKAVLASLVVLALAVSSVGATYSWFSDTVEISTNVSAAKVEVDFRIIGDDGSGVSFAPGERSYSLRLVNHSTIAVSVEPALEVTRYYAATDINSYRCDVSRNAEGWNRDNESTAASDNGKAAWSGNDLSGYMIGASFGGSVLEHFTNVNTQVAGENYEEGGTSYNVYKAVYSISTGFTMDPGEVRDIQFDLKVDSRYSFDDDHKPKLLVRASQSNEAGSIGVFHVSGSAMIGKTDIGGYDSLEFSCSDGSSIILDRAAKESDWDSITVSFSDSGNVKTLNVQAEKSGVSAVLEGWIHYRVAVDGGVTGVTDGTGHPVSVMIADTGSGAHADFIDLASESIHRISYA